jgi:hypothetical protein
MILNLERRNDIQGYAPNILIKVDVANTGSGLPRTVFYSCHLQLLFVTIYTLTK